GRRPADHAGRAERRNAGGHVPGGAVHVLLLRQHRPDLPGRGAALVALPVPGPALGPVVGRVVVPAVRGGLPGGLPVVGRPAAARPRRRLRTGQPRLAVRQGPVRVRFHPPPRSHHGTAGPGGRRFAAGGDVARGPRRRRGRPGRGAGPG